MTNFEKIWIVFTISIMPKVNLIHGLHTFGLCSIALLAGGCVQFSAPPPLITAGGPGIAQRSGSEVALAMGTGLALFDDAHSGGSGWFGRWRYGFTDKMDIGLDAMGAAHGDTGTFNFKAAARYKTSDRSRVELGIGAADNSDGKSLSVETALTVGPEIRNQTWNRYASLRFAAAKGYPENSLGLASNDNDNTPPDTYFGLLNLGLTAKLAPKQKVFFELGVGYIDPESVDPGAMLFWGIGLIYDISEGNAINFRKPSHHSTVCIDCSRSNVE